MLPVPNNDRARIEGDWDDLQGFSSEARYGGLENAMSYVRNAWYVAVWSHEIKTETPFAMAILGERVVIWRTASGALHALEDRCVHRLAPMSLGRCEGEHIRCMYHGMLFNPDGRVVEIPGQDIISKQARVQRYAVVERHSWIWIWMEPRAGG